MLKLIIATTNMGKIKEIEKLLVNDLPGCELFSLTGLGIDADCPEEGETFLENATTKSLFYSNMAAAKNLLTVAEDSGLSVAALQGAPGVYSARYAGEDCNDDRNIDKLLAALKGIENRQATFVTEIVLSKNGEKIASFRGEAHGVILEERRGSHGFGYDPVFYFPSLEKTFAQLTTQQKNEVSHRAAALRKLRDYLLTLVK